MLKPLTALTVAPAAAAVSAPAEARIAAISASLSPVIVGKVTVTPFRVKLRV